MLSRQHVPVLQRINEQVLNDIKLDMAETRLPKA